MRQVQYLQLISRIVLLLANGILVFIAYTKGYTINTIGLIILLCFQTFLFINYIKNQFADIEKSIDCLIFDDYTNTIPVKKRKNSLYNKTAILLEKQRKQHLQKTSEQLIFTNIIESLSMGTLILRKSSGNDIEVFQLNKSFLDFLKIPRFYNWNLLKTKIGNLTDFIIAWKKFRHTVTLQVNDEKETFFLKTSVTKTNEYEYLVVTLETIQQLIDKKEKEAWYKLMNVMSHEIINTITPISSLAESLSTLLQEDTDEDSLMELSEGLQIIKRRSSHLTSFVDTYRKLTELPLPKKQQIDLLTIVDNTLLLFEKAFAEKNIYCEINTRASFIVNVDKQQIEQVLINLISNSIYALEGVDSPKILIEIATKNSNRTTLSITDNGKGIPKEIKDNIFIPYFTTRKNGSGIGLTLSKSIMEAHQGTIHYTADKPNKTKFTLTFIG